MIRYDSELLLSHIFVYLFVIFDRRWTLVFVVPRQRRSKPKHCKTTNHNVHVGTNDKYKTRVQTNRANISRDDKDLANKDLSLLYFNQRQKYIKFLFYFQVYVLPGRRIKNLSIRVCRTLRISLFVIRDLRFISLRRNVFSFTCLLRLCVS